MPEGMPREQLMLRWFAKTYGFTEQQSREELSLEALEWWPLIEQAFSEAERMERAAEERMAKRSQRG
jgi:hypothetical protein